ncbi:MAG: hypothetical protein GXP27_04240 [Planctomycetes bacterium]|nr:hypothetical protein [Planctomycetota bacterium]
MQDFLTAKLKQEHERTKSTMNAHERQSRRTLRARRPLTFCLFLSLLLFALRPNVGDGAGGARSRRLLKTPGRVSVAGGPKVNEAVFFSFDDHAIPWRNNLKVTMVRAKKHPANPVLRRGPQGAPDHGHAILYGTVLHIGGKFRMWYLGVFESEIKNGQAPGWWRPMCYAESDDGVNWRRPELGLVELHGNRKNNVCLIESEVPSLAKVNDFLSVIYEPDDPDPRRRYKCAYIAHPPFGDVRGGRSRIGPDERRWAAFVCATSADGFRWKVVGDRPINAGGERFEVSGLYRFGRFYYATGQLISPWTWRMDGRNIGRVMLVHRSADFEHWSRAKAMAFARPGQLTSPPIAGQQTHMGAGLWNRGNVIVGLYGMWHDAPRKSRPGESWNHGVTVDLGLIVSNDGIHFREPVPDHKVIARGVEGEWDSVALLQGHAFVNIGDKTMMWYSHWDTSGKLRNMEIGLATMRRDGFGYLSRKVANSAAHFVTSAFETEGRMKLFVNAADVSSAAPLTIELLDELARPLPGFSGESAARVSQPGTHCEVVWPSQGSSQLPQRRTLAVKVRFPETADAKVYAVYVGAE